MMEDEDAAIVGVSELNSLGYYPPARALVVRATSRVHTRLGGGLLNPRAGGGMMGQLPNGGRDVLVFGGPKLKDDIAKKDKDAVAKVDPKKEYDNAKPNRVIKAKDWQEAFVKEKIKDKAGWVIAIANFLGEVREFGQAADVLKTNLRLGFVNEPWVFEALAIALQESGATPDEVERAKLSCIDLDPKDPQAYLRAAKAMAEMKEYDRAIGFCRQASAIQPEIADPYSSALAYIGKLDKVDSDATAWAVTNLLKRDWSADSDRYHESAKATLADATVKLENGNRAVEAARIHDALSAQKRRDLVIELNWDGDADLDLRVVEPIGTTCSSSQRQTPGGSYLNSDSLKKRSEVYTVSEAFNGTYEVKVDRVWGRTITGKAQVKVIRHQGTPDQFIEYHTIALDKAESVKIPLTGGRRTALAAVAPPITRGHPEMVQANLDRAVQRLRALADPTYAGADSGMLRSGGVGSSGCKVETVYDMSGTKPTAGMTAMMKVDGDATDLTAKTSVTTNKKGETEIRVRVAPVYETAHKLSETPAIDNPLIPGGK
jgi:tetratricopeptide (TPR) repeat protein